MPLTLPALFVYIEVKDYIPAAFAGFLASHFMFFSRLFDKTYLVWRVWGSGAFHFSNHVLKY